MMRSRDWVLWEINIPLSFSRVSWSHGPRGSSPAVWKGKMWLLWSGRPSRGEGWVGAAKGDTGAWGLEALYILLSPLWRLALSVLKSAWGFFMGLKERFSFLLLCYVTQKNLCFFSQLYWELAQYIVCVYIYIYILHIIYITLYYITLLYIIILHYYYL